MKNFRLKSLSSFKLKISNIKFIIILTSLIFIVSNALIIDKFVKWFTINDVFDIVGLSGYFLAVLFLTKKRS